MSVRNGPSITDSRLARLGPRFRDSGSFQSGRSPAPILAVSGPLPFRVFFSFFLFSQ